MKQQVKGVIQIGISATQELVVAAHCTLPEAIYLLERAKMDLMNQDEQRRAASQIVVPPAEATLHMKHGN